jgi:hypothetical protein
MCGFNHASMEIRRPHPPLPEINSGLALSDHYRQFIALLAIDVNEDSARNHWSTRTAEDVKVAVPIFDTPCHAADAG